MTFDNPLMKEWLKSVKAHMTYEESLKECYLFRRQKGFRDGVGFYRDCFDLDHESCTAYHAINEGPGIAFTLKEVKWEGE